MWINKSVSLTMLTDPVDSLGDSPPSSPPHPPYVSSSLWRRCHRLRPSGVLFQELLWWFSSLPSFPLLPSLAFLILLRRCHRRTGFVVLSSGSRRRMCNACSNHNWQIMIRNRQITILSLQIKNKICHKIIHVIWQSCQSYRHYTRPSRRDVICGWDGL